MRPDTKMAAPGAGEHFEDAQVETDDEVVGQRLGDELVLVHLRTNQIFILNRTAARFWELLESGTGIESIEEILLQEFAVEQDALRGELDGFVTALLSEELVSVRPRT